MAINGDVGRVWWSFDGLVSQRILSIKFSEQKSDCSLNWQQDTWLISLTLPHTHTHTLSILFFYVDTSSRLMMWPAELQLSHALIFQEKEFIAILCREPISSAGLLWGRVSESEYARQVVSGKLNPLKQYCRSSQPDSSFWSAHTEIEIRTAPYPELIGGSESRPSSLFSIFFLSALPFPSCLTSRSFWAFRGTLQHDMPLSPIPGEVSTAL